jgi:hypothetical protein
MITKFRYSLIAYLLPTGPDFMHYQVPERLFVSLVTLTQDPKKSKTLLMIKRE